MDIHEFSVQYGLSKGLILICCIKDCGTAEFDCSYCSTIQSLDFQNHCLLTKLSKKIADFFFFISGVFFFQAEDGIRDAQESRGLGDVYKRQIEQRTHGYPLEILGNTHLLIWKTTFKFQDCLL